MFLSKARRLFLVLAPIAQRGSASELENVVCNFFPNYYMERVIRPTVH